MFASIASHLPETLLRALRHAKAFAMLDDPPPTPPIETPRGASLQLATRCAGDRRRSLRADRPLVRDSDLHRGRDRPERRRPGAVGRPVQPCHSPVTPIGAAGQHGLR